MAEDLIKYKDNTAKYVLYRCTLTGIMQRISNIGGSLRQLKRRLYRLQILYKRYHFRDSYSAVTAD
jgi:hypothetical protein